ncbi:S1 family peptidase [Nonomuraea sp. NEAU-A123]|uniref:S1 family peptidase n=1 Tax=Nonomuraea sp. NEAU-A123 TaxID=2839649 RepID=UPI001BE452E2|nr:S1 family peptidase [Nonomuraea sp. NEAU-A123]MBT2231218.1 hypothetical protein [Nonomuraea sp. NEAU-A123]
MRRHQRLPAVHVPDFSHYNGERRVTYEHQVIVEGPSEMSAKGDSGGPWYFGNTAYGIHHGGALNPPHNWGMFTPVHFLRALGAFVYQR